MLWKTKQDWGRVVIAAAALLIICQSKKASLIRWPQGNKGLLPKDIRRNRCSTSNPFKSENERRWELARNFIGTVSFTLGYLGMCWSKGVTGRSEKEGLLRKLMPFPGERWWLLGWSDLERSEIRCTLDPWQPLISRSFSVNTVWYYKCIFLWFPWYFFSSLLYYKTTVYSTYNIQNVC